MFDLLEDRPKEITVILSSLKYWDRPTLLHFMEEFIQYNCDKITFTFPKEQSLILLSGFSDEKLKSLIISLLQPVKDLSEITLPKGLGKQGLIC